MFKSLLIANRGEIACRVVRACREMGISPVAIFSEVDQNALHTHLCDSSFLVGPSPSAESYLRADRIVELAKREGIEAIHPGYGFLSENAHFARTCTDAGITFIGPSPTAISMMGDKIAAREQAQATGVPVIPGTNLVGDGEDVERIGAEVGFPLVVKASGGGGGMGIQLVERPQDLRKAIQTAKAVGKEAFGNDDIYMERFLGDASHIEVQVAADTHGNAIHLFERDCSTQRRNQKLIEEAPASLLDDATRRAMCDAALQLTRHINYHSVGTVEFLAEPNGRFYFLEMNTRIQVEHPITEMTTGIDLVQLQIRIAAGEPLNIKQADVRQQGHSIEARVLAEDSYSMLPSPGVITELSAPKAEKVRLDSGVDVGSEISSYYDPLIAKVVSWADTRELARQRLVQALRTFHVKGVMTNIPLLLSVLESQLFRAGKYGTKILNKLKELEHADEPDLEEVAAIVALLHFDRTPLRVQMYDAEDAEGARPPANWWSGRRIREGWWQPINGRGKR